MYLQVTIIINIVALLNNAYSRVLSLIFLLSIFSTRVLTFLRLIPFFSSVRLRVLQCFYNSLVVGYDFTKAKIISLSLTLWDIHVLNSVIRIGLNHLSGD